MGVQMYWVGIHSIKTLKNKPTSLFEEPLDFLAHGHIIGRFNRYMTYTIYYTGIAYLTKNPLTNLCRNDFLDESGRPEDFIMLIGVHG